MARYEAALMRLRPVEREAVIARCEWGLSHRELGELLGKTAGATQVMVYRALDGSRRRWPMTVEPEDELLLRLAIAIDDEQRVDWDLAGRASQRRACRRERTARPGRDGSDRSGARP